MRPLTLLISHQETVGPQRNSPAGALAAFIRLCQRLHLCKPYQQTFREDGTWYRLHYVVFTDAMCQLPVCGCCRSINPPNVGEECRISDMPIDPPNCAWPCTISRDRSTELVPRTRTRWRFSTWALWPGSYRFRIDKRCEIVYSFRSMNHIEWGEAGYMWRSSWYFSRCRFVGSRKLWKKWKKELIWEGCSLLVNIYQVMHVKLFIRLYSPIPVTGE